MLKILLLEDDPAKKTRLLSYLESKANELFETVDTALSVDIALRYLKECKYDLLIADVIIPAILGGGAHEQHSINLFDQIDQGIGINIPHYAIAISASDELSQSAYDAFVGRPWGIIKYSESNSEWLVTIEKICHFIVNKGKQEPLARHCDVFVITALERPEFTALESLDMQWSPLEPFDRNQLMKFGQVIVDGSPKTICAAFAPRMGPVASAILVTKAILKLQPKLIIMCGICAGIPGKVDIGDVVAVEVSWDWQSGKYLDKDDVERFEARPHHISINDETRNQLILLKRDKSFWASLAYLAIPLKLPVPKLVLGPMATGSSVLSDSRVAERIKSTQHNNLTGLDMEVYGVYAAAHTSNPDVRFVAMKAVCDKGDKKKDDEFQSFASSVAAAAVLQFIMQHSGPLLK